MRATASSPGPLVSSWAELVAVLAPPVPGERAHDVHVRLRAGATFVMESQLVIRQRAVRLVGEEIRPSRPIRPPILRALPEVESALVVEGEAGRLLLQDLRLEASGGAATGGPWDPTTDLPPAESEHGLPATDGETAARCRWHSHGARCRCVCESHRESGFFRRPCAGLRLHRGDNPPECLVAQQ